MPWSPPRPGTDLRAPIARHETTTSSGHCTQAATPLSELSEIRSDPERTGTSLLINLVQYAPQCAANSDRRLERFQSLRTLCGDRAR
jgi:hypothetical protein